MSRPCSMHAWPAARLQDTAQARALASSCAKTVELNERQACDVFCLVNGAFSPLTGFMDEHQYNAVVSSMRLPENSSSACR